MLWFWVIVLVVLIGAVAIVASGRGDTMDEVYEDRADVGLPVGRPLTADDLRAVRFNTGVRGYRMDEVDALLVRLEAEMLERDVRDVRMSEAPGSDEDAYWSSEPAGDLHLAETSPPRPAPAADRTSEAVADLHALDETRARADHGAAEAAGEPAAAPESSGAGQAEA